MGISDPEQESSQMSAQVVLIAGSPQHPSRSTGVLHALAGELRAAGIRTRAFGLGDFEPADLVFARSTAPAILEYVAAVQSASAIAFATPVYKATYSGGLKLLLDLIPPDALRGKSALGIATARLARHFPGVQRAFEEVQRFFEVGLALPPVLLLDEQVRLEHGEARLDANAESALGKAASALSSALGAAGKVGEG
jgi:FMN reductase